MSDLTWRQWLLDDNPGSRRQARAGQAYRTWLASQGDVGLADLVPLLGIPLFHPFAEWLIHVHILHHRPRRVLAGVFGQQGLRWEELGDLTQAKSCYERAIELDAESAEGQQAKLRLARLG